MRGSLLKPNTVELELSCLVLNASMMAVFSTVVHWLFMSCKHWRLKAFSAVEIDASISEQEDW